MTTNREKLDMILENIEKIIDDSNVDDDTKEQLRTVINQTEELFSDMQYMLEEAQDEISMYVDNMHGFTIKDYDI